MKYGYAGVSMDGQSVGAQVSQLTKAGRKKVFRETASGAKTHRAQLIKARAALEADDVMVATRLDRLARSTRGMLNTWRAQGWFPLPRRKLGGYHHGARWLDADRARWPGRI